MIEAPLGGFGVIYADPPWTFKTHSDKGKGRSAEAHYDCMSRGQLLEMFFDIDPVCAQDCVLLMWVTDPMLLEGLGLIRDWGFEYKTVGFYWAKTRNPSAWEPLLTHASFPIGTGYWTRANPEQCLLATRGHPKRLNADVHKLIVSPRREHSRKPDVVYDRIERLCAGPYLELFARRAAGTGRSGWTYWGDQAETGITGRRWASKWQAADSYIIRSKGSKGT